MKDTGILEATYRRESFLEAQCRFDLEKHVSANIKKDLMRTFTDQVNASDARYVKYYVEERSSEVKHELVIAYINKEDLKETGDLLYLDILLPEENTKELRLPVGDRVFLLRATNYKNVWALT